MARIRTIKPSFWGDDKVCRLSWDARLLLIGIISTADDQGRFIATPQAVLGYVFPHEDVSSARFKKLMAEIVDTKIVALYEDRGRAYGYLPHWRKHQRINKPSPSTFPAPPQEASWE